MHLNASSYSWWLLAAAALSLAVATGLGAYASHGLESRLTADAIASFQIGVDYQFFHSLGLIGLAIFLTKHPNATSIALASIVVLVGMVLFCGGLYASSLGSPRLLAHAAPLGGTALILGWLVVAYGAIRAALTPEA